MGLIERIRDDITFVRGALRTLRATTPIAKNPRRIFPLVIEELADRFGDAQALLSERETFTYRQLAERSNRYARWALAQQIGKGDVICLLMSNRPEYWRSGSGSLASAASWHCSTPICAAPPSPIASIS